MTQNPTIAERLQPILAARLETLTGIVREVCGTAVGQHAQDAIIADLADRLQDTCTGLHATIEDIQDIGANTLPLQWADAEQRSFEISTLLQDYGHMNRLHRYILQTGAQLTGLEDLSAEQAEEILEQDSSAFTQPAERISALALYSYMKAQGVENQMTLDRAAIYGHVFYFITAATGRQGTAFDGVKLTQEELEAITPVGCSPVVSATLLKMNRKELQNGVEAYLLGKTPKQTQHLNTQVISTLQNTADILSRSLITADMDEDGQALIARPLLQALQEKKQKARERAAEMARKDAADLTGEALTEWIDRKANSLTPSATYIMQALRGAVVISNLEKPTADGEEKATYRLTLRQLTQHSTGQKEPNNEQIQRTWEAFRFLSTQQVEFIEYRTKKDTRRRRGRKPQTSTHTADIIEGQGQEEKTIYTPYRVLTNPMTATFVQELTDGKTYSGSTEVFLDIHHIITEGRRQEVITMKDGSKAFIKRPVAHLNSMQQLYSFSSVQEIRFYGVVLSKSHILEEDLLQQVFDYDNRIACSEDEQKERRSQQKNKGRDREQLHDMFIKAKATGLIAWYSRQQTIDKRTGKPAFVWKWGRPEGSTKQLK